MIKKIKNWLEAKKVDRSIRDLHSKDTHTRKSAIEVLISIGEASIDPLVDTLKNSRRSRDDIRQYAAEMLGEIGNSKAVVPLINAINDGCFAVRRSAIQSLAKISDRRAVEPLISVLNEESNSGLREFVIDALVSIGNASVNPLISTLECSNQANVCMATAEALGKIGDSKASNSLIKVLKHKHAGVRETAAEALGKIGDPNSVSPLLEALKDEDYDVRQATLESLEQLNININGLSPVEQAQYYIALGKWNEAARLGAVSIKPLITMLKVGDVDTCSLATEALAMIGSDSIKSLIYIMKYNADTRCYAIDALVNIGSESVEPLIEVLKENNAIVRKYASQALGRIGDSRAVIPLIEVLKNKDYSIRRFAAQALYQIGGDVLDIPPALQVEYYIALEKWNHVAEMGDISIEPLINILKVEDAEIRKSVTETLGKIGDSRAVIPLIDMLKDKNASVRKLAAQALGLIGEPIAVDPLIETLKDIDSSVRKSVVKALGEIRDHKATLPIIQHDKSGDSSICKIVIKALGQIGDSRAVDWLIGLLDDHSCHELAAEALGQIGDIGSIRRLTEIAVKNGSDALLKAICNVGTTQSFCCLLNHIDDGYDSCCDIDASMQSKILRGLIEIIQRDAEDLDRDVLFRASKMPDIRVSIQKFKSYEVEMEDEFGRYTYRPWYYVEENLDCSSLRELAQRELSSRG